MRSPVTLQFNVSHGGDSISCSSANRNGLTLTDLRFFVSDVALIDASGERHAVPLLADEVWQTRDVALVDLETGEGRCVNGTLQTNRTVRGTVAAGNFETLHFTVGVPFVDNHSDPLRAFPPLDDPAMHWHWRSGYKFLRAGVASNDDGYWLHLGSNGCKGRVGHIESCSAPNRVAVSLPVVGESSYDVTIDLAVLLREIDLDDQVPTDCSSGPAETGCGSAFEALGLPFNRQIATGRQRLFKVVP